MAKSAIDKLSKIYDKKTLGYIEEKMLDMASDIRDYYDSIDAVVLENLIASSYIIEPYYDYDERFYFIKGMIMAYIHYRTHKLVLEKYPVDPLLATSEILYSNRTDSPDEELLEREEIRGILSYSLSRKKIIGKKKRG